MLPAPSPAARPATDAPAPHPSPAPAALARRFKSAKPVLKPLALPPGTSAQDALGRVLRLPSVASKRFLTTKVDRHVTGASFRLPPLQCRAWDGVWGRRRALCMRALHRKREILESRGVIKPPHHRRR